MAELTGRSHRGAGRWLAPDQNQLAEIARGIIARKDEIIAERERSAQAFRER